MSFLIQRSNGRNLTLTQISTAVLRIGRGTNQELRSENPAVALEHARIESDVAGYFITDKGSITGTYVNRKPVETARLAKGDVIEVGDLRVEVQLADPAKPLFLRVVTAPAAAAGFDEAEQEAQAVATPGARVVKSKKIDYAGVYRLRRPWLTKVSITALLLIVTLGVIGEVIRPEKQKAFMPGGLSSAHALKRTTAGVLVADDCAACHLPWKSVSGNKCLDCHPQQRQPHAEHELDAPDCFACHAEHRGALKLSEIPDTSCVGCHSNLGQHMRGTELVSLRFANGRYGFNDIARINAFGDQHPELSYPRDANTLRFNHKLHLAPRGVFNGQGKREILACTTCHDTKGRVDPKPVDFEEHCQRCHRLSFDARFPDAEVPHGGDNGIVYGAVLAYYSGDRDIVGKPPAEVRRILTARRTVNVDARALINAENVFKIRCRDCHEIQKRGERLAVTPPVIPTSWLSHAKFTHDKHRMACESCHGGPRASALTSDVLMPRRQNCTTCHAQNAQSMQAASSCLTCHEYHLRSQRQAQSATLAQAGMGGLGGGGRMLQGILLAVIVVLLLVVLVPVGIALFQRLRPARAAAPPRAASPPPRAPSRPMPEITTDKIPRQPPAPPDIAAPKVVPEPVTRIDIPDRAEPAPAGTEMLQWYGMLNCTAGPLEGQRFIIEDEGFYIGRDPALAKVVIPDTRVSKRHLRILPRDGKVWAIDQNSTNGTFLGGQRITEVQLKRGDTLVLGDNAATFVYQI